MDNTDHVQSAGRLGKDHEVCHSKWSCYSHKVLQNVFLSDLLDKQKQTVKNRQNRYFFYNTDPLEHINIYFTGMSVIKWGSQL